MVLGLAAAAALVGVLLKATERGGPDPFATPVAPVAEMPAGTRAPAAAASRHEGGLSDPTLARAERVPAGPTAGAPLRPPAGFGGGPEVGRFTASAPITEPPAGGKSVTTRRSRPARPGTSGAPTAAGSLKTGTAGSEGAATLRARAGGAAAGGQAAVSAPADAPPDDEGSRLPPDVAYDSGEALLSTSSPVEVPEMGKLAGGRGTVSLWLKPQWEEGNHDDAAIVQLGGDLQLVKNVNFLRFELARDGGAGGVGVPITDWKPGEWHQVAATWNGNQLSLYVDGQLASTTTRQVPIELPPDTTLRIGSDFPLNRPIAPAVIGRVDLRTRPLAPAEIARAYDRATSPAPRPAP